MKSIIYKKNSPLLERNLEESLLTALRNSPVVYLNGPRQAGKSTLVQGLSSKGFSADYVTFDSATQMSAAAHSPEAFLRTRERPLIIDEAQLVPELFRALKVVVDELRLELGNAPEIRGRFLLTGSANVLALPQLSDAMVGRMLVRTLYPFSATEVRGLKASHFLGRVFSGRFDSRVSSERLLDVIRSATFPEISELGGAERSSWFEGYLTTLVQRDIRSLAEISKLALLPNLLRLLAARAGGLVNDAEIARDAGLNPMTTRNYKGLFKALFLIFELEPWYRNVGKRLVKSPKGYFVDTSLLCHLSQYELEDLEVKRPELFGHVVENFVATELLKAIAHSGEDLRLLHFRTGNGKEVDFVLEKKDGTLVGIEVKKRDRVESRDFEGLRELRQLAGKDFIRGIVLYSGEEAVPFDEQLWAVPISNLWA